MYARLSADQSVDAVESVVRPDLVIADSGGTVLVASGDPALCWRISEPLLGQQFVVLEAADAATALGMARLHPVDVAVVDVAGSGIDAQEFLRRWRQEHPAAHVPVLMLAARAAPEDVRAGIQLGAHDFLLAPYEQVEVLARVHSALGVKRHHDDVQHRMAELQLLARTDALTGLYNRRHVEAELTALTSAARRRGTPLGLLLVDVDRFKRINDRVSHEAGDVALRTVAHRIRSIVRAEDLVGRWGGDEFVVLLPATDLESTIALGQRLRRDVAQTTDRIGGLPLTVSIGCAAAFDPEEAALVGAADAALHRAKAAGRNRAGV